MIPPTLNPESAGASPGDGQTAVVISLTTSGPPPRGLAGYEAVLDCTKPVQVLPRVRFGRTGGRGSVFVSTQPLPPTMCTLTIVPTGATSPGAAQVAVSVDGGSAASSANTYAYGALPVSVGPFTVAPGGPNVVVDVIVTFPLEFPRGIQARLEADWAQTPIVVLEGLRAVGKTTLVKRLAAEQDLVYRDLTLPAEYSRASADPQGWLESLGTGVVIDEAQRLADLFNIVKVVVDANHATPSQFVMTGSARLRDDGLSGSDPIVARDVRRRLHPFTQCEREGTPRDVITALFDGEVAKWSPPAVSGNDVLDRLIESGFPTFWDLDRRARVDRLARYASGLFAGHLYETGRSKDEILRTFRFLSSSSGRVANLTDIGRALGHDRRTIDSYIDALIDVHLVERVKPLRRNLRDRETASDRIYVADAAFIPLPRSDAGGSRTRHVDDQSYGTLLETFAAMELLRLSSWSTTEVELLHWRMKETDEVDIVLERDDERLVGIEVKAAVNIDSGHLKGLRALRRHYSSKFHRGFVLHPGRHTARFEDDLWALPFSALWSIGSLVSNPTTGLFEEALDAAMRRTHRRASSSVAAAAIDFVSMESAFDAAIKTADSRLQIVARRLAEFQLHTQQSNDRQQTLDEGVLRERHLRLSVFDRARRREATLVIGGELRRSGEVVWSVWQFDGPEWPRRQVTAPVDNYISALDELIAEWLQSLDELVAWLTR